MHSRRRRRHDVPEVLALPDDAYAQSTLPEATIPVTTGERAAMHDLTVAARGAARFLRELERQLQRQPDRHRYTREWLLKTVARLDAALDRM